MRKAGKIMLRVIGWLLVAVLLFIAGTSVYSHVKLIDKILALKEMEFYNPVSTGDHCLNMYRAVSARKADVVGCGSRSVSFLAHRSVQDISAGGLLGGSIDQLRTVPNWSISSWYN